MALHMENILIHRWHPLIVIAYFAFYGHTKLGYGEAYAVAAYCPADFKFADAYFMLTYLFKYLKYHKGLLIHM
jgi:hypothetical protein